MRVSGRWSGSRAENVACLGLLLIVALLACKATGSEEQKRQEQVESAEEALARAQREECERLRTKPNTLLETSRVRYHDKGIINDYRQLSDITVLNKARYCAVRSAEGDVVWFDDADRKLGSSPFSLKKSIPAGATETFTKAGGTLTSGTIQGKGKRVEIRFTNVVVVSP